MRKEYAREVLGWAFLLFAVASVFYFERLAARYGVGFACLGVYLAIILLFVNLGIKVLNERSDYAGLDPKQCIEAIFASARPQVIFFGGGSYPVGATYFIGMFAMAYVMLPLFAYLKLNGAQILHIPTSIVVAVTAYSQVRIAFEFSIFFAKTRRV
ncbi:MAG: hypothetical protein JKY26_16590 [Pseudomonas sp.]|uniref:hypothetical protein n=1 Tax=Halopseudomonas sp. TaxID=2901191 RepID=UPI001A600CB6|nr:hypothetical protein [Pseudomonas sp.]